MSPLKFKKHKIKSRSRNIKNTSIKDSLPLILINFKTYPQGTGERALKLAKTLEKITFSSYQLAIAPQIIDLKEICQKVKLPVFAQHLDNISYGPCTGKILPQAAKEAGAKGTLINHSERKISFEEIKGLIKICRKLSLLSVVCVGTLSQLKKILPLQPTYFAYEPPSLIGKNLSVTQAKPQVIKKALALVKKANLPLLVGAGIHTQEDIEKALRLGAKGVLLAHKIVKAKKPLLALKNLLGENNKNKKIKIKK